MRFAYRNFPPSKETPQAPWKSRPVVAVRLFTLDGARTTEKLDCLVDSGADTCMFDAGFAYLLGMNLEHAKQEKVFGVSSVIVPAYILKVRYQIVGDTGSYEVEARFVENLGFAGLLGQEGFFDRFMVKFELCKKRFEITPVHRT